MPFNKVYICLLITITAGGGAVACDVCNVFEYANRENRSFGGVFYRMRMFNGYAHLGDAHRYRIMPGAYENMRTMHEIDESTGMVIGQTPRDYESYQTVEFRFNYTLKEKWNLQLILPYAWNKIYYGRVARFPRPETDTSWQISGAGDPIIMSDRILKFETGTVKHILRPGAGIKIPLGKYKYDNSNPFYAPEAMPGSGAWDFIARTTHLGVYKKVGTETSLSYKLSSTGAQGFTRGRSFNFMSNVFAIIGQSRQIQVIPKAGVYYEQAEKDRWKGITAQSSGGKSWFGNVGIDFVIKSNFIVQTLFQQPLAEDLNGDVTGNAGRMNAGVIWNF